MSLKYFIFIISIYYAIEIFFKEVTNKESLKNYIKFLI